MAPISPSTTPDQRWLSMADPIHGLIRFNRDNTLHRLLLDIINSFTFQRLRRIRQMGMAEFVFPGATHSRFVHSIGTLWLTLQAIDVLKQQPEMVGVFESEIEDTEITIETVLCVAALLHDVGHPPLSHTLEYVLELENTHALHDVMWNSRIVEEDPDLKAIWKQRAPQMPLALKRFLGEDPNYNKGQKHFLADLVSGQLDMDRLDYLVRDSHYLGVQYGRIEAEHIISNLVLDQLPDGELVIAIRQEALPALEHYLFGRLQAYKMASHHLDKASEVLLKKTFDRFFDLDLNQDDLAYNEQRLYWMKTEPTALSVEDYLYMDDGAIWQMVKHWAMDSKDESLKKLAKRLLRHDLFKVIDLADYINQIDLEDLLSKLTVHLEDRGLPSRYSFTYEHVPARELYQRNKRPIYVRKRQNCVVTFDEVSPLALTPQHADRYLLFVWDKEAKAFVKAYIDEHCESQC